MIQSKSTSQGLPYDFSSIMHFQHNEFSLKHYKSTIVPHNRTIPKAILGSRAKPTDLDFLHLNLLYCGGKEENLCIDAHFMVYTLCNFHARGG